MLLCNDFLVNIDGTFGISDPFVLDVEVAHFPCFGGFGIDFLLDSLIIQEPADSDLIKAWHVSLLLNALIVNISDIWTGVEETGFNWAKNLLAFESVIQALFFIQIVNLIWDEVMAFQVADGKLAELFVGETFVAFGAGVVEKEASELDFKPGWGEGVSVEFNDNFCDSGSNDACVLLSAQEHGLIFELREFFVEFLDGQVVELGYGVIGIWSIGAFWESDFSWSFDEENVGFFVPVERIDSEVFGAFDKDEGSFGVEGTVKAGASRTGGDSDDQGIFEGVAFGGEVTVVVGLVGGDVEISGVIGMGEESDG